MVGRERPESEKSCAEVEDGRRVKGTSEVATMDLGFVEDGAGAVSLMEATGNRICSVAERSKL